MSLNLNQRPTRTRSRFFEYEYEYRVAEYEYECKKPGLIRSKPHEQTVFSRYRRIPENVAEVAAFLLADFKELAIVFARRDFRQFS